jgi:hypothetical protein
MICIISMQLKKSQRSRNSCIAVIAMIVMGMAPIRNGMRCVVIGAFGYSCHYKTEIFWSCYRFIDRVQSLVGMDLTHVNYDVHNTCVIKKEIIFYVHQEYESKIIFHQHDNGISMDLSLH